MKTTKSIRAKKTLGQNFLNSKKILNEIVDEAGVDGKDIVVEVGPGKGSLTEILLKEAGKVIAIEKDHRLIPVLEEKFSKEIREGRLDLMEKDILDFDPTLLEFYKEHSYTVVANIPYYITGKIIPLFLESKFKPEKMVLLVQKEVAERIVARDGKESILSLSVKAFATPKYIKTVNKKYFSPKPKIDSAILSLSHISGNFFNEEAEKRMFFNLVHAGFSSKRKKLINNLKPLSKQCDLNIKEVFEACGIDLDTRAERLPIGTWKCLTENFLKNKK